MDARVKEDWQGNESHQESLRGTRDTMEDRRGARDDGERNERGMRGGAEVTREHLVGHQQLERTRGNIEGQVQ